MPSRWCLTRLALVGLVLAGCHSLGPGIGMSGGVTDFARVDDVPLPPRQVLSDLTLAVFRSLRGKTDLLSEISTPASDSARRLVIVSWTDGARPAASAPGSGRGVTEAVRNAVAALRNETVPAVTWGVSIDFVEKIESVPNPKELRLDRLAHGLVFVKHGHVLLPEQLRARALISEWGRYTAPALDRLLTRPAFRFSGATFSTNGSRVLERRNGRPLVEADDLSEESLATAIRYSEHYLRNIVDDDGRFLYQLDTATGRLDTDYNLARHAGTLHALIELYASSRDADTLVAVDRALGFLIEHCKSRANPSRPRDEEQVVVDKDQIRLTALSLSLLAIAKYIGVTGDTTSLSVAIGLGNFVRGLQQSDGRYAPHTQSFARATAIGGASQYAPGEADFALCGLYDITADSAWLDVAERNVRYLIETRDANVDDEPHDHWLLYALDRLDAKRPHARNVEKAKRIVASILSHQSSSKWGAESGGWRTESGAWVAPAATRAEGLLAATRLFGRRGEHDWERRTAEGAKRAIAFLMRTQIVPENSHHLRMPSTLVGGFPSRIDRDEVRIDYVQHAVAAISAYREWRRTRRTR